MLRSDVVRGEFPGSARRFRLGGYVLGCELPGGVLVEVYLRYGRLRSFRFLGDVLRGVFPDCRLFRCGIRLILLHQRKVRRELLAGLRQRNTLVCHRVRHDGVQPGAGYIQVVPGDLLYVAELFAGFLFGHACLLAFLEVLLKVRKDLFIVVNAYPVQFVVKLVQEISLVFCDHSVCSPFSSALMLSTNSNHSFRSVSFSARPLSVIL